MIYYNQAKSGSFFRVSRNFVFLFIVIAGMSLAEACRAKEPTAEEEYKAQRKFLQLQSCVDYEDYVKAPLVLDSFLRDFAHTNFYERHSERINKLAKKIAKETKKIKSEDRIEYVFIRPRLKTKQWKGYMSRAESIISRDYNKRSGVGITVLRVIFEDEDLEVPSIRSDRNSNNELHIYSGGGGYSCVGSPWNGDAVFVGSQFRRRGISDLKDKNLSAIGDVIVGGVYHYPTRLKIEVQEGKVSAFGEVFVRSIPQKYRGNLKVKVEAEDGLKLINANVGLEIDGFFRSGKTMPVKDNSCLFNSIGPGKYKVKLAPNDIFGSPGQSAEVSVGQTTEVTINAYKHRMLELDWRFRKTGGPYEWKSGKKLIRTKESWRPEEWADIGCTAIEFGDWINGTCKMRRINGDLIYLGNDEPFETMEFPEYSDSSGYEYLIKEGDILAWQRKDHRNEGSFFQALIRISKITPVGLSDEPKTPDTVEKIPPVEMPNEPALESKTDANSCKIEKTSCHKVTDN